MKKSKDFAIGLIWLAFSLFYLFNAMSIKVFEGEGATWISSRTIPMIWGICMALLSLNLIRRGMKQVHVREEIHAVKKSPVAEWLKTNYAVPVTFVLLLLYAFFMKTAGFILMTTAYLFFQISVLTPREKQKPVLTAILSVGFTIIVYYLFVFALNVPLPAGILG